MALNGFKRTLKNNGTPLIFLHLLITPQLHRSHKLPRAAAVYCACFVQASNHVAADKCQRDGTTATTHSKKREINSEKRKREREKTIKNENDKNEE